MLSTCAMRSAVSTSASVTTLAVIASSAHSALKRRSGVGSRYG